MDFLSKNKDSPNFQNQKLIDFNKKEWRQYEYFE